MHGPRILISHWKGQPTTQYQGREELLKALQQAFMQTAHVDFNGTFEVPAVESVGHKERIQSVANDIWKATGYRFTYVTVDSTIYSTLICRTASRTTLSSQMGSKRASGVLRTTPIDPNLHEQRGKRRAVPTSPELQAQARRWRRLDIHVAAAS
jgi:hypothetical protein